MPPAFGTGPSVGPDVTPATIAEAEKLVQIELTPAERAQAAGNWRVSMAPLYERRTGPRRVALDPTLPLASRWDPRSIPGAGTGPAQDRFVRSTEAAPALPTRDEDIAFASVRDQSRWIESRALTSERLTRIYLERLERFQPKINAAITITRDLALAQARAADAEIAAGRYRGPLHGIPWGAKDLVDTAGIPTTYGAEPFRNRVPAKDAVAVERLHKAGAVLVAKLSLGALALNDIWFGGQTNNPWLLEEGASGSSAGPGAATASACVVLRPGQRDGRQHHRAGDARRRRGPASDLRPRAAHGRHDAVLVAGQARAHGPLRRGHPVRAARALRPRCRRRGERAQPSRLRRPRRWPGCAWATSRNG